MDNPDIADGWEFGDEEDDYISQCCSALCCCWLFRRCSDARKVQIAAAIFFGIIFSCCYSLAYIFLAAVFGLKEPWVEATALTSALMFLLVAYLYHVAGDQISDFLFGDFESERLPHDVRGAPIEPGACGLMNLGNTCYMSSTVQCLSHLPELREFFVSGDYKKHIQKKNPLGSKGEIANAFAELMAKLWSDEYQSIAPTSFKRTLDKHAPQFKGHDQHDSQELLSVVLDKLHEDVNGAYGNNRQQGIVKAKNPAAQAWESYLQSNSSVIVDLFQGQLASALSCPKCAHASFSFEPFMYLTLPLPEAKQTWRVLVVEPLLQTPGEPMPLSAWPRSRPKSGAEHKADDAATEGEGEEWKWEQGSSVKGVSKYGLATGSAATAYTVQLSPSANVKDLIAAVQEQHKVTGTLLPAVIEKGLISLAEEDELLSTLVPDNLVLYRSPDSALQAFSALIPILHRRKVYRRVIVDASTNKEDIDKSPFETPSPDATPEEVHIKYEEKIETFGLPLLLIVRPGTTLAELQAIARAWANACQLGKWEEQAKATVSLSFIDEKGRTTRDNKAELGLDAPRALREGDLGFWGLGIDWWDVMLGGGAGQGAGMVETHGWKAVDERVIPRSVNAKGFDVAMERLGRPQAPDIPCRYLKNGKVEEVVGTHPAVVSLTECLHSWAKEEQLGDSDRWKCPKCAENVKATKSLKFGRLPEVLVVVLKRFLFEGREHGKDMTLVDFPLHDLDMSRFVENNEDGRQTYDLFAVSRHSGTLSYGHYTSVVKGEATGNWVYYDDEDATLLSDATVSEEQLRDLIVDRNAYVLFYRRRAPETRDISSKRNKKADKGLRHRPRRSSH